MNFLGRRIEIFRVNLFLGHMIQKVGEPLNSLVPIRERYPCRATSIELRNPSPIHSA